MSVPAKYILPSGFEDLKHRIKQRGYVKHSFIKRGEELPKILEEALIRIEKEFGDIVTSIYIIGKLARGQVDDFINLAIVTKKMFGNFMFATHGVFVEKVFEPILLEKLKDKDMPFIFDPLYFTLDQICYSSPSDRMKKVVNDIRQHGILVYGVDIFDESGSPNLL